MQGIRIPMSTPVIAVVVRPVSVLTPRPIIKTFPSEVSQSVGHKEQLQSDDQSVNYLTPQLKTFNDYLADIAGIKTEIDYFRSQFSDINERLRNTSTLFRLPSTNTQGIGNITLNPKVIEPETATVSGTTTTGGLVVSDNTQD